MNLKNLIHVWVTHLIVSLWVGIILGTIIGLIEGISVLVSQDLVGRYNELVAWAIVFDASAVVAVELGIGFLSALVFTAERRALSPYRLVALQIGESAFAFALAMGIWAEGTADPTLPVSNPLGLIGLPFVASAAAGACALVVSRWMLEQMPLFRRLRPRYWLVAEAAVLVGAIAFSFSH